MLSQFVSLGNAVLIFDDLERCGIPINEVLGYINGFVEHQRMKVIVVANQKEVNKESQGKNQELKYMIASNTDINIPKEKTDNRGGTLDKFSINDLKYRADRMFSLQNEYEIIKEKIFGLTIHYYPNLEVTLRHIIAQTSIDRILKEKIENNFDFYIRFMKKYNHINFRTFQFYLSKLQALFIKINTYNESDDFIDYIVQYCFDVCCEFKLANEKYSWEDGSSYFEVDALSQFTYFYEFPLRLRCVDEFVKFSYFNDESMQDIITFYNKYYSSQAKSSSKLLKNLRYNWYVSSEQQVQKWIDNLINNLDDNKYDFEEYNKIIDIVLNIVITAKFDNQLIQQIKVKMIKNIQNSDDIFEFNDIYKDMISDQNIKKHFVLIIAELNQEMNKKKNQSTKDEIKLIMTSNSNWIFDILNLDKNKGSNNKVIDIFEYIDVEIITDRILNSTVENLSDFRKYIQILSDKGLYLNKINGLYNNLKNSNVCDDRIFKMQYGYLLNDLKRYIESTQEDTENHEE